MLTRKYLYSLHREKSKHQKHSANILSRASTLLDKAHLLYNDDPTWPFHLIVYVNSYSGRFSIYAGGFSNLISILPLKSNGSSYKSAYEKSFLTPEGSVNYIKRKYNKGRRSS